MASARGVSFMEAASLIFFAACAPQDEFLTLPVKVKNKQETLSFVGRVPHSFSPNSKLTVNCIPVKARGCENIYTIIAGVPTGRIENTPDHALMSS